ncbi:MAG: flagellin N-terminal helical domain-containing protein [Allosphingosinicella sp.]
MITGTRYRLTQEISRQQKLASDIQRGMIEISTGKRIQAPSDDPVGAARVSELARMRSDSDTWKRNLQQAASLASRADDAIGATQSSVTRAKELMLAGATGTMSADDRATIALELRALADEILSLAGSSDPSGVPLFQNTPLEVPAGEGVRITAAASRNSVFQIDTAGGPKDLVRLIRDAAAAIVDPDSTTRAAATNISLAELDDAVRVVARAQGEQGTRGQRIANLLERIAENELTAEEERTAIESTDVMEVVARLQSRQLTLQAAQAAFARINSTTLFDLLR